MTEFFSDLSFTTWFTTIVVLLIDFFIRLWVLIYVPKRRKPTAAMAWLLLLFIVPFVGVILFLAIGSTKLSRARRKKQEQVTEILHAYTQELKKQSLLAERPVPYDAASELAGALSGLYPTRNNTARIITGYGEIIDDIIASINSAEKYVYIEFYILALDVTTEPFFEALKNATQRGVKVYVLFDAWGSKKFPRYKEMQRLLTDTVTGWHKILPLTFNPKKYNRPDLRNHRKIVVVDNSVAYIGSLNMIDKTYHRKDEISYIELAVRLEGPSVNNVATVFASDWYMESDTVLDDFMKNSLEAKKGTASIQIVPSGPGYPYPNNLKVFVSLIHTAKKSISITNPYLVPDESLLNALISAAQRGVEVSVLNSEAMDQWLVGHAQRSYYGELLEAGIHIYLYKRPQLVHEKFFSVDDEVAVIGSSNLDIRSFELNLECTVVGYDVELARTLHTRHKELLRHSKKLTLAKWQKRNSTKNLLDSIARLTSALQ